MECNDGHVYFERTHELFDKMPHENAASWNTFIRINFSMNKFFI